MIYDVWRLFGMLRSCRGSNGRSILRRLRHASPFLRVRIDERRLLGLFLTFEDLAFEPDPGESEEGGDDAKQELEEGAKVHDLGSSREQGTVRILSFDRRRSARQTQWLKASVNLSRTVTRNSTQVCETVR